MSKIFTNFATVIPDNYDYSFSMLSDSVNYIVKEYHGNVILTRTVDRENGTDHSSMMVRNAIGYNEDGVYYHYIKNHLGSNCAVVRSESNETVQSTIYYPSGVPMRISSDRDKQPYLYGDKEFVEAHGLNEYDSQARMYYATIMRTTTMDPLAEEYYHISPYAWCGNNPIAFIDPDGRSFSDFDEEGNYLRTSHDNWWHNTFVGQKGRVLDSNENVIKIFNFADPGHDVADLKSKKLNKLQFVQESDIVDLLKNAGAFDDSNRGLLSRYIYAWNEGQAFGELDFAKNPSGMGPKYSEDTYKSLYLVGGLAHNPENFGNFLFGAAGVSLGIHPSLLLVGGHVNSLIKSNKNGYPSQLDSFDDQLSIFLGTLHANLHFYPFKSK